jgi:hypothetical protein
MPSEARACTGAGVRLCDVRSRRDVEGTRVVVVEATDDSRLDVELNWTAALTSIDGGLGDDSFEGDR